MSASLGNERADAERERGASAADDFSVATDRVADGDRRQEDETATVTTRPPAYSAAVIFPASMFAMIQPSKM